MFNDDDSIGGFLGLITLGAAFFIGRRTGENRAYKEISEQLRDNEIAELKKQIQYLQENKN